jgi:hypothetical protein
MNAPGYDNIYGQLISTSGELIGGWPAIADLITPIGSYFYVYTSKRAGQLDKEILLSVSIYDKRWGFLASSIIVTHSFIGGRESPFHLHAGCRSGAVDYWTPSPVMEVMETNECPHI